ncbi:MAG: RNase adapter RapZ [Coriobacteriia bacterium]|nr:RNase adapter RapZ [Coriobacteriia bacterium]
MSNEQSEQPLLSEAPDLVIITGMSGAGRTEAMHTLEDLGYFCIDNLPPAFLIDLVKLAGLQSRSARRSGSARRLAVVCDLRAKEFFSTLTVELALLRKKGLFYTMIFLDATDEALLARFKASRRRHPLCEGDMTITEGITAERNLMGSVREIANFIIDTSKKEPRALRKEIHGLISQKSEQDELRVAVSSFGFKHNSPHDADIIIDVRFLPNPYYEEKLRAQTGLDDAVRSFVLDRAETKEFLHSWYDLLRIIMPGYVAEGKRYLSLAIGCTGGQHRSVTLAEETGAFLKQLGYQTTVTHRDLQLAEGAV